MKRHPYTQMTLRHLTKQGWALAIVEKWVPFPQPGHRVDVWGFGDILGISPNHTGAVLIQTSSMTGASKRRAKIRESPEAKLWLSAGNRILGIWWRKLQGVADKRPRWVASEQWFSPEDMS